MTVESNSPCRAPDTSDPKTYALDHPVFVVGAPRSGTTWLQRLLLSHPRCCGGQESLFFLAFGPALRQFDLQTRSPRLAGLANYWKREDFAAEVRRLWYQTMAPFVRDTTPPPLLVEKSPPHALFMAEIRSVLPAARFIHMIRDSRAVVASILAAKEDWGQVWATNSAAEAARTWVRHVSTAREVGRTLPEGVYTEVFYEELFARPVDELLRLLQFLGLDASTEQVQAIVAQQDFDKQKQTGGTPFVRKGDLGAAGQASAEPPGFFRKGKPEAWKSDLTLKQKLIVWYRTRGVLAAFGYPRSGVKG